MSRLAIVTTHPIQYYAPVFKAIAQANQPTKVFYTWGKDSISKYDPDFQRKIEWDLPLLEGYEYEFLKNISANPGTGNFNGIVNPDAVATIDSFNPDVVLVYGWSWKSHLKIIRHYAKSKNVWFRGDSTLLDKTSLSKKLFRFILLRWVYSHVHLAFYVGSQNKKYFRHFGLKERQLVFAPHAIENERFSNDRQKDAKSIRDRFAIPDSGILILFAGKFEPKKDPLILLEAFEDIKEQDIYVLFAGNGILEKELKSRASRSKKKDKIFFLDFQNQTMMPALYQASQVYCLPSVGPGETWGLAVNEAMAAGCAILVSDKVGCAVDLIQVGVNGYIFENKNKGDLSQKMSLLFGGRRQLNDFGKSSRKIIENWTIENQVSLILNELNKV